MTLSSSEADQAQPQVTQQDSQSGSSIQFTTRLAQLDDADSIATLGTDVFTKTFGHSCSKKDLEDYLQANFTKEVILSEIGRPDMTYLVTCEQEQIVAFGVLRTGTSEPCLESFPGRIELQRFYVDNAFHGSGVARVLLDAVIRFSVAQGYRTMWLGVWEHNARAKGFYRKYGFALVGSHDFMLGRELQIDEILVKQLK